MAPMVMITVSMPLLCKKFTACFADNSSITFMPVSISVSFWLGVMIEIFFSNSSFNFAAGAGLRINFIFFDAAMVATCSTVSIGVSN